MITSSNIKVSLESVLVHIGFELYEGTFRYDFGNCILGAIVQADKDLKMGYSFYCYYETPYSRSWIKDFFMPLYVNSYREGLALIAYYLKSTYLEYTPDWMYEGFALQEYLPWEKIDKYLIQNRKVDRFYNLSIVTIDYEWFQVLVKKIRALVKVSTDDDITTFYFDGEALKVVCNNQLFIIGGIGNDWMKTVSVKTQALENLPKRILKKEVYIYIL